MTVNCREPATIFFNDVPSHIISPAGSYWKGVQKCTTAGLKNSFRFHVYEIVECMYFENRYEEIPPRFQSNIIPCGIVMKLLGRMEDGRSICMNVFRQQVYFYVKADDPVVLTNFIRTALANTKDKLCNFFIEKERKRLLKKYDTREYDVFKVTLQSISGLSALSNKLMAAGFEVFESNVDATRRFILDNDFSTFAWYSVTEAIPRLPPYRDSWTDVEYDCAVSDLKCDHSCKEWPRYTVLSFDIECIGSGGFPKANVDKDMIVQISCVFWETGGTDYRKVLLTVGTCASLEGIEVYTFPSEFDLLIGFLAMMRDVNVEFVTGYNISNFDFQYLIDRAQLIYNIPIASFCKVKTGATFEVVKPKQAPGGFARSVAKVRIAGIIPIDMYTVVKDKLSLSDYKLNTVAQKCLGTKKDDVSYKEIPVLFRSGSEGRAKVGHYCVMDSVLVMDLLRHFMTHVEIVEIAKLSKLQVRRILCDGQQMRVFTCLLEVASREGYILPVSTNKSGDGYQGATVIDPVPGFYNLPILVMDFASLYPSIMQAHNLCYSTIIHPEDLAKHPHLTPDDYETFQLSSGTVHFVKSHVSKSFLSQLLEAWLSKRKEIRKQLASCQDETMKVILDKQQLAIKVTCNSVYGFTGVATGLLPCIKIAETVTFVGRRMLDMARAFVDNLSLDRLEEINGKPLGFSEGASLRTIYGDTDSLFVLCNDMKMAQVLEFSDKLAGQITRDLFSPPIKLESEKVFDCLMLLTKKRYIGILSDGKLLMKGVDLIRKTSCKFVQNRCRKILDLVLRDEDVKAATQRLSRLGGKGVYAEGIPSGFLKVLQVLIDAFQDIRSGAVPFSELTLSTELSKPFSTYKNINLPHLRVYQKIIDRGDEPPSLHDRIQYVFVRGRSDKLSDLAEDPIFAEANKLPPASGLYFDKLIHGVANIIQCVFGNDSDLTASILYNFLPMPIDFNKNM